jgi:hypothetical protein
MKQTLWPCEQIEHSEQPIAHGCYLGGKRDHLIDIALHEASNPIGRASGHPAHAKIFARREHPGRRVDLRQPFLKAQRETENRSVALPLSLIGEALFQGKGA